MTVDLFGARLVHPEHGTGVVTDVYPEWVDGDGSVQPAEVRVCWRGNVPSGSMLLADAQPFIARQAMIDAGRAPLSPPCARCRRPNEGWRGQVCPTCWIPTRDDAAAGTAPPAAPVTGGMTMIMLEDALDAVVEKAEGLGRIYDQLSVDDQVAWRDRVVPAARALRRAMATMGQVEDVNPDILFAFERWAHERMLRPQLEVNPAERQAVADCVQALRRELAAHYDRKGQ